MAFLLPTTCHHHHHQHRHLAHAHLISTTSFQSNSTLSCSLSHPRRSFLPFCLKPIKPSSRRFAASPGPGPPLPPNSEEETSSSTGYEETFSRVQDKMQIFFAVLFWMSLFFWSCAWNGKDDAGRPNKGSQFRR